MDLLHYGNQTGLAEEEITTRLLFVSSQLLITTEASVQGVKQMFLRDLYCAPFILQPSSVENVNEMVEHKRQEEKHLTWRHTSDGCIAQ